MGYELTVMADEGILLTTLHDDFSIANEAPRLLAEMKAVLDSLSGPVYMVDDFRRLRVSFSDLVAGLAVSTRGNLAVARHPNIRKLILISTSELLRFGGNALKQPQYGGSLQADIYPTWEAALAGIREEIAAGQS